MATMLDCKKIQPQLSEYVDGALPADTAWDIKMHLASCAVCSQVAGELSTTARLLNTLPSLEPSLDFEAKLAARLADRVLQPRRPSLWDRLSEGVRGWWAQPLARPALASGVALAALLPVVVVLNQGDGGDIARTNAAAPVAPVARTTPAAKAADRSPNSLDQIWREHNAYASSEPLGDGAGLLPSAANAPTDTL